MWIIPVYLIIGILWAVYIEHDAEKFLGEDLYSFLKRAQPIPEDNLPIVRIVFMTMMILFWPITMVYLAFGIENEEVRDDFDRAFQELREEQEMLKRVKKRREMEARDEQEN